MRQSPPVVPTSTPSVAPVFATDADALAAAKTAYAKYLAVSAAIAGDGGKRPERIVGFVDPAWLPTELRGFQSLEKKQIRLTGTSTFSVFVLQNREVGPNGLAIVRIYVCEDVTPTRVIDAAGRDITPTVRKPLNPLVVKFVSQLNNTSNLLYSGGDPWAGSDFC